MNLIALLVVHFAASVVSILNLTAPHNTLLASEPVCDRWPRPPRIIFPEPSICNPLFRILPLFAGVSGPVRWKNGYTAGPLPRMPFSVDDGVNHCHVLFSMISDTAEDMFPTAATQLPAIQVTATCFPQRKYGKIRIPPFEVVQMYVKAEVLPLGQDAANGTTGDSTSHVTVSELKEITENGEPGEVLRTTNLAAFDFVPPSSVS